MTVCQSKIALRDTMATEFKTPRIVTVLDILAWLIIIALCANMTETSCMTAISEQGGKENQHGDDERFCSARYRCDGRS